MLSLEELKREAIEYFNDFSVSKNYKQNWYIKDCVIPRLNDIYPRNTQYVMKRKSGDIERYLGNIYFYIRPARNKFGTLLDMYNLYIEFNNSNSIHIEMIDHTGIPYEVLLGFAYIHFHDEFKEIGVKLIDRNLIFDLNKKVNFTPLFNSHITLTQINKNK